LIRRLKILRKYTRRHSVELTIEQALQQGIAAHKEGKAPEAERLYRAIIQSQPLHPDANHNLGVLAVSVNQAEAALQLFKIALEANPKIEQFWLSYIDTLIKDKQFDNAKQVLEQGRNQGVAGEKLNVLEIKLASGNKPENVTSASPSHQQLSILLEHYQNGRFDDAKKLAVSFTNEFPKHQFGWKALGAILTQTGRVSESLVACQKSVQLAPKDADAHSNLGNTLKELGILDEAEVSCQQAIALKPDHAEAHSNLGNTLQELGRLDEAEASYTKAIALKPDLAQPHNNLGITLQELGRLDEAEASYTQAIALKPNYAEAHNNLGAALQELGRLEEAEAIYRQAIALKPNYSRALHNLSIVQGYMNNLEAEIVSLRNILSIDTDNYGLRAGVNLAICDFLDGDFENSKAHLLVAAKVQEKTSSKFKNEKAYWRYLLNILKWHEDKYFDVNKGKNDKALYVIGESHSLTTHYLRIQRSGIDYLCKANLIKGCMQWHLGNSSKNQYKNQFENIFSSLPNTSKVLLTIGEIDCRLDNGIIKHKNKFPEKVIEEIIATTVENYLTYIIKHNSSCHHNIIIQGVPCPNIDTATCSKKEITQLIEVIKKFNCELKNKSKQKGFEFLDVHKLTDRGDGFSNTIWHIDNRHLSPAAMLEALSRYASE